MSFIRVICEVEFIAGDNQKDREESNINIFRLID